MSKKLICFFKTDFFRKQGSKLLCFKQVSSTNHSETFSISRSIMARLAFTSDGSYHELRINILINVVHVYNINMCKTQM